MMKIQHYIGGEFCKSGDISNDTSTFHSLNPATGEPLAEVSRGNSRDIEIATKAASRAHGGWSKLSMEARAQWLTKIADGISANAKEFARLESLDTGKPISLSQSLDIPRAISNFRFFAELGPQLTPEIFSSAQGYNYAPRESLGVVGLITPWNLPLYLLTWKLAPALIMGNTVVAKPSELTPLTANRLAEILYEMKFPEGVVNIVHGFGDQVGEPLVAHPNVAAISFTGGTSTGRRVAQTAAPQFKKVSLELGGKNPILVFEDVDILETAKAVARSAFLNQGQICLCGSRLFVSEKIYDVFLKALIHEISQFKMGDPLSPSTTLGSLISLSHREKVIRFVELARSEGGHFLSGGKVPPNTQGAFFEPTLISNIEPTSKVSQEEIFGPVLVSHSFCSTEEVIDLANSVPYGLSASVWSKDIQKARHVAERLQAGVIWINSWLNRDLRTPFGGWKASGLGVEGGFHSLDFFSRVKNICMDSSFDPQSQKQKEENLKT